MSHKKYRTETNCLNCGAEVTGKFCSNCGQENVETLESFVHLAFHTIGDFFHFDSKFFRSLIPLITKPGFLTKEYWAGRRMHYIHPLRLFFFITIVMVIVTNAYYRKFEKQILQERITRTETTDVADTRDQATKERQYKKIVGSMKKSFSDASTYLKYISFLLLPIYALGFRMLYFRHKRFYIEHLVFTLHLQSFVYIIFTLMLLIPLFITPDARSWFMYVIYFALAAYTLISLRRIYRQSWLKTFFKTVLAMGYIFFVTVLFLAGMIIINILG